MFKLGAFRLQSVAYVLVALASSAAPAWAQTIDDGVMVAKHALMTGNVYSFDRWDQYWEGALKRTNGNVGTVTTKTNIWSADYGVTDRLNVIVMAPYVWTHSSQGILHGYQGFQDLTLAAKYNALETRSSNGAVLRAIGVVAVGLPLTDYNVELLPLSIGLHSKRLSGRGTLNAQTARGWFANASGAYTWRSDVFLDRPYYYTDNQFVMSNQVDMPSVFDYGLTAGYAKRGVTAEGSWTQQWTLGGGDIRKQDVPFVSNQMNFGKAGAMLMYPVPKVRGLCIQVATAYTVIGRNVGQSTTFNAGLMYTLHIGARH
jgi:hypothetical protein